jgi:hypothetical protein
VRQQVVITTDVRGHSHLACRRLGADDLSLVSEGLYDLNTEVDVHRRLRMSRIMVEKTVMPANPQTLVTTEELPNEIKRRLPGAAYVSAENAPAYSSEGLRRDDFCFDPIIHGSEHALVSFNARSTLVR